MNDNSIEIVAAVADNNAVGLNGHMPWHIPEDLKHFKKLTLGKAIIMGKRTWESLANPLGGRLNIIVSKTLKEDAKTEDLSLGVQLASSLNEAITMSHERSLDAMVIGGSRLWEEALPLATKMNLTLIHDRPEADTFFPDVNFLNWKVASSQEHVFQGVKVTFATYIKMLESEIIQ